MKIYDPALSGTTSLPSITAGTTETNIVVVAGDGALKYRSDLSLQGTAGTIGTQGTAGSNGAQGTAGTAGTQGTTGTQGTAGTNGTQGTAGSNGTQGTAGSNGTQGTTGTQGTIGTTGPQGTTGASAGITSYTNPSDNRVITSVNSTTINAESGLTFDGATLGIYGTQGSDVLIQSGYPTIIFKDTDNRTGYWHMNGDQMYLLSGANGAAGSGWTQVSSQWPFIFNTANNSAACGGALTAVGDITAYSSDVRLKENIVTINNPIEKLLQLRGVYYDWKDGLEEIGFVPQQKHDIGVIAQELELVIPEAIKPAPFDTEKGISRSGQNYKTVQMDKIIPILIESVKEQQKQINELKELVQQLSSK